MAFPVPAGKTVSRRPVRTESPKPIAIPGFDEKKSSSARGSGYLSLSARRRVPEYLLVRWCAAFTSDMSLTFLTISDDLSPRLGRSLSIYFNIYTRFNFVAL